MPVASNSSSVRAFFFFFPLLPLVFPKYYSSGRVYVLQLFQLLCTVVRLDPGGMVEWKERGRTLYNLMIKSHSFSGPVWDMYDLYKCFSSVIASSPHPQLPSLAAVFPIHLKSCLLLTVFYFFPLVEIFLFTENLLWGTGPQLKLPVIV